eukprot:scaffold75683_cov50-Cyclotella_meneghiniana.AAC.1
MSMWYRKIRKSNKAISTYAISCQQQTQQEDTDKSSCDDTSCDESSSDESSCSSSSCSSSHGDSFDNNPDSNHNSVNGDDDDDDGTIYSVDFDKPPSIPAKHLNFVDGHPARMYTKLTQLKQWVIPLMFYEDESLCSIEHLQLDSTNVNIITEQTREYYAKTALLMFYPFRCIEDIMLDGSHWKLFHSELQKFNNGLPT